MCHLLGLDPAPNNGSLEVLYDTLNEKRTKSVPNIDTLRGSGTKSVGSVTLYAMSILLFAIFT